MVFDPLMGLAPFQYLLGLFGCLFDGWILREAEWACNAYGQAFGAQYWCKCQLVADISDEAQPMVDVTPAICREYKRVEKRLEIGIRWTTSIYLLWYYLLITYYDTWLSSREFWIHRIPRKPPMQSWSQASVASVHFFCQVHQTVPLSIHG